ncbi:MAG: PAS domain S-box protein [Polyangiaceae bacterium]|nr:PAS domain S-box protein [Polyangiaceae bacterium]
MAGSAEIDLAIALERLELHARLVPACALSFGDQLYRRTMAILSDAFATELSLFGYLETNDIVTFPATTITGSRGVDDPPALHWHEDEWAPACVEALRERRPVRTADAMAIDRLSSTLPNTLACPIVSGDDLVGLFVVSGRTAPFSEADVGRIQVISDFVGPFVRAHLAMVAAFRMRAAREAELARVEAELRKSERRFKDLAELLPQTVFEVDVEGRFTYVNRHGFELTGYTEEDVAQGLHLLDIMALADRSTLAANFQAKVAGGPDSLVDYHLVRKSGETVMVRVHSSPIVTDGATVGLRGVLVDMTEVRRVQELAYRAQRLETAGRVAGQVAHDFNNLLGPLLAYPELLLATLPREHPGVRYAGAMLESAQRLSEISQQLLALGRRGNYALERHDLNQTVREAMRHVASRPPELEITLRLEPELMAVLGGAAQLLRVVTNLIVNARQAMGDCGQIIIATENVYLDAPTGVDRLVPRGEYVRLTVADNGPGIPAGHRSRIFDPFFSTKPAGLARGSGLGLSSVHAIIEDHRGFVDFETEVGHGTQFHIYLPVYRSDSAPAAIEGDELVGGSARLLVVDDDGLQREVARSLLETLGYEVELSDSGEHALHRIAQSPPDLLVLDMILPGGIDGAETFRRALTIAPRLRAILVTGYAGTERIQAARELGVLAIVRKPLTLRSIGRAVRQALAAPDR